MLKDLRRRKILSVFLAAVLLGLFTTMSASSVKAASSPQQSQAEPLIATLDVGAHTVYGLRPGNGAVVWQYTYEENSSPDQVAWSMRVYNHVVYVSEQCQLFALRAADGMLLWHQQLQVGSAVECDSNHLVAEDQALFLAVRIRGESVFSSLVYAFQAATGEGLWKQDVISDAVAGIKVSNGVVYGTEFGANGPILVALSASDGRVMWEDSRPDVGTTFAFLPAGDAVYVVTSEPNVPDMLQLSALKSSNGAQIWTHEASFLAQTKLAIADKQIFAVEYDASTRDRRLCGYKTSNGASTWCYSMGVSEYPYPLQGHQLIARNGIVYLGDAKILTALRAKNGEMLWESKIVETGNNARDFIPEPPVIADGILSYTKYNSVVGVSLKDGSIIWQIDQNAAAIAACS